MCDLFLVDFYDVRVNLATEFFMLMFFTWLHYFQREADTS